MKVIGENKNKRNQRIPVLSSFMVAVFTVVCAANPLITHAVTKQTETAKTGADDLSIIMVGDILLHDGIEKCAKQEDGKYDFSELFKHTGDVIEAADLAIVNQEVVIGGEELRVTGYPSFNAPYAIADDLAEAGFDIACHATNHALDRGARGIRNCLDHWKEVKPHVTPIGIYDSESDSKEICIYEKNGYKIAVLNYTYGTNGIALPEGMPYAVNLLDEKKVKEDLAKAESTADFTIVCPHWGTEYSHGISDSQKKWAKIFVDNGADLVIGTHPHVIEPVEKLTSPDGRVVPVYYSLGNYVNWTSGSGKGTADRMVGAMAIVKLSKDKNGDIGVSDYGVKPLMTHVESKINGSTVFFLEEYTQARAFQNEIRWKDPDFSYKYCEDLCYTIFEEDLWR